MIHLVTIQSKLICHANSHAYGMLWKWWCKIFKFIIICVSETTSHNWTMHTVQPSPVPQHLHYQAFLTWSAVHPLRSNQSSTWPETFAVPWDTMPEEVWLAIANNNRPAPDKWRQMIQIFVEEMRKYEADPTCKECLICQNIVRQYPSSFAIWHWEVSSLVVILSHLFLKWKHSLRT